MTFVALLFYSKQLKANEGDFNAAFANFIKLVYVNVETVEKSNRFCIFGSDDISLQIIPLIDKNVLEILNENIDPKRSYKKCRVVYVAKSKQKVVKSAIVPLNKSGALTIATFNSFVNDGGMFSVDVGRRNFELTVNSLTFKESGVKIDSSIIGLIVERR